MDEFNFIQKHCLYNVIQLCQKLVVLQPTRSLWTDFTDRSESRYCFSAVGMYGLTYMHTMHVHSPQTTGGPTGDCRNHNGPQSNSAWDRRTFALQ